MDAHCSPERPETRKLVHSTAQTRPGRTQSTLRGTARPTHNHGKIETQTCGGEIATAPAVALMMASRAASSRTLPAHSNRADGECCACQIRSGAWTPGCGHMGVRLGGHTCAHRRSCRSGRSSEPGCEAGTHPRDGQGRALLSTRPLGSGERKAQRRR